jgi:hypothetical protein
MVEGSAALVFKAAARFHPVMEALAETARGDGKTDTTCSV